MDKKWIKCALVRSCKTIAQTAAALIGTGAVGLFDVDWLEVLSVSVLAGILSILTSIGGLPELKPTESEDELLEEKPELPEGYFEEEDDEQ